jgi:hypothetical protein
VTIRRYLALVLVLNAPALWAQEPVAASSANSSAPDSSATATAESSPVDVGVEVLECAVQVARSAGFRTQVSVSGRVLHALKPHLQSMDTNEMDYVWVHVYGRGSAKGLRWEVKAHTITGTAMITTSVYSPRPPSRDADRLRRSIQKNCAPQSAGAHPTNQTFDQPTAE